MKPTADTRPKWRKGSALAQAAVLLLTLSLASSAAGADTTNFIGDFSPSFWSTQVQLGSVIFTNSDTELVLAGPNAPAARESSSDGVLYNGPLSGGLTVGGTLQFSWVYNSGDALSTSEADFAWLLPSGGGPIVQVLAQGGPGVTNSGVFTTPLFPAGTTFQFLLTGDTPANKLSDSLLIADFDFLAVPEPPTGALATCFLTMFFAARWWRSQPKGRSGRPNPPRI